MVGKHIFLHGKVQGVGLRYHTHEKARELGVRGWVRNLDDGRVEAIAFGEPEALEKLVQWLHQGTSAANVTKVEVVDVQKDFLGKDFSIRRDGGPTWPD